MWKKIFIVEKKEKLNKNLNLYIYLCLRRIVMINVCDKIYVSMMYLDVFFCYINLYWELKFFLNLKKLVKEFLIVFFSIKILKVYLCVL